VLLHLVKVGRELRNFQHVDRSEQNVLKGCHSTVWLESACKDNKLYFFVDSNTAITRRLLSLLLRIYNGQPSEAILASKLFFTHQSNLSRFIGAIHSNGFATIDREIRERARGVVC
jgi:cysteine desulfuration protein SufE